MQRILSIFFVLVLSLAFTACRSSNTVNSMKEILDGATFLDGLAIRDSNVRNARNNAAKWLRDLKIIE